MISFIRYFENICLALLWIRDPLSIKLKLHHFFFFILEKDQTLALPQEKNFMNNAFVLLSHSFQSKAKSCSRKSLDSVNLTLIRLLVL